MNIIQEQSIGGTEQASTGSSRDALLPRVRRMLWRLSRDQRGANFLEYAVLCGCVAIAGITAVGAYGDQIIGKFGALSTAVDGINAVAKPAKPAK